MTDNKVVSLKLADKQQDKTLIEVLEQLIQDWKDGDNHDYDNLKIGVLVVESDVGTRIIPLKDDTTYHYIGVMEVAKNILVESTYDYEDE